MFDSKAKIFRYWLLCFILGVGLASFFVIDIWSLVLVGGVGGLLFWPKLFWRVLFLGIIMVGLGVWRYQLSLPITDDTKIWFYNGQQFNFQGLIINEPDVRIDHTKLTVESLNDISGKVLIKTALYPQYHYGDLLDINCSLKSPIAFDDFSYDRYLAKDNIYTVCYYPKISMISQRQGNFALEKIFLFKTGLQEMINANLPEPQASLFSAIILGSRRSLPQDLLNSFNLTGTSHIISISGLHITILVAILLQTSIHLHIPRSYAFWLITVCLFGYLILIGAPPSAVRAAVMGWLTILAMNVGRLNQSVNALLLAAGVMLLFNPKILRDDIGFQLSFCAMLGLIYFLPAFEERFNNLSNWFSLKTSLLMTVSAQLATLPLIIFYFGNWSLVAPLVNLLILPLLPYLMVSGFGVMGLSLIFPAVSQYLFWIVWLILTWLINIVEFFGSWFFAALKF